MLIGTAAEKVMKERYHIQIKLYAEAIQAISGKKVVMGLFIFLRWTTYMPNKHKGRSLNEMVELSV